MPDTNVTLQVSTAANLDLDTLFRVFMGRDVPGESRSVSDNEIRLFLEDWVTPRFPNGHTLVSGTGAWKDFTTGLTIQEDVIVLEVVGNRYGTKTMVREIAKAWKLEFNQDAVMVTTVPIDVDFV